MESYFNSENKLAQIIKEHAQEIKSDLSDYDDIINSAKNCQMVLIGEASHGTEEFYSIRAEITKKLITEAGYNAVAIEGDWPDAYHVNRYVNLYDDINTPLKALSKFERFPTWMWQNKEVEHFIKWLHDHNEFYHKTQPTVGFYGLDLYSLNTSISAVIEYLQNIDEKAAEVARQRYECLEPFTKHYHILNIEQVMQNMKCCEKKIIEQLLELRKKSEEYLKKDGMVAEEELFCAQQNAKLIKNAEKYYLSLYTDPASSWNLRDSHMMETLQDLQNFLTKKINRTAKIVVWAHNSHIGDARATAMHQRGEINIGQLVREKYQKQALLVGFSTYEGTVTAASNWGGMTKHINVLPAINESCAALFHKTGIKNFLLNFKDNEKLKLALAKPRPQRFIGVIYRPDTEYFSHYYNAQLSEQFDFIIHIDKTSAVEPLYATQRWHKGELSETYPFGI